MRAWTALAVKQRGTSLVDAQASINKQLIPEITPLRDVEVEIEQVAVSQHCAVGRVVCHFLMGLLLVKVRVSHFFRVSRADVAVLHVPHVALQPDIRAV